MKTKFNGLLIIVIGIMTLFSGLLVFIGWQMNSKLLETFAMGSEPMKPASSLSLLLLGLALILQQRDDFRTSYDFIKSSHKTGQTGTL